MTRLMRDIDKDKKRAPLLKFVSKNINHFHPILYDYITELRSLMATIIPKLFDGDFKLKISLYSHCRGISVQGKGNMRGTVPFLRKSDILEMPYYSEIFRYSKKGNMRGT
jgi:hypothetical protein